MEFKRVNLPSLREIRCLNNANGFAEQSDQEKPWNNEVSTEIPHSVSKPPTIPFVSVNLPPLPELFIGLVKRASPPRIITLQQLWQQVGHLPVASSQWTTAHLKSIVSAFAGVAGVINQHDPEHRQWWNTFHEAYTTYALIHPHFGMLLDPVYLFVDFTKGGTQPLLKPAGWDRFCAAFCSLPPLLLLQRPVKRHPLQLV